MEKVKKYGKLSRFLKRQKKFNRSNGRERSTTSYP